MIRLLQLATENPNVQELTLKVPLLGKVNLRRNSNIPRTPNPNDPPPYQDLSNPRFRKSNKQFNTQEFGRLPLSVDNHITPTFQGQERWQWVPLSWSIEDQYENFFQDALMENIEQYTPWQKNNNDFPSFSLP